VYCCRAPYAPTFREWTRPCTHQIEHTLEVAGITLDVWSFGNSMATTRPMVTRRLDAGFAVSFSLKNLYPSITAGDIYALQLRAYLRFPHRSVRVIHAHGQATVHVGHCLLSMSMARAGGAGSEIVKGTTQLPLGLNDKDLYHLHVSITWVFLYRLCCFFLAAVAPSKTNLHHG
jgi:hypothetical protein